MSSFRQRVKIPDYTKEEERFNSITHILGGVLSALFLALGLVKVLKADEIHWRAVVSIVIYGFFSIALYTCSSVYHGLSVHDGKRVMRVIDHCSIYFLIAATYTPYLLLCVYPVNPKLCWYVFAGIWALTALGSVLNAVNMEKFKVVCLLCYLVMGWLSLINIKILWDGLGPMGFGLLLAGGIIYTVGALLYVFGKKWRWFHGIFHLFVVGASVCHFCSVYFYVLP